jgi:hypothetical protein
VLFSQELSQKIYQGSLTGPGNPTGQKIYIYPCQRQSAGCFVEVELAESSGNNCFQNLLFDIHA